MILGKVFGPALALSLATHRPSLRLGLAPEPGTEWWRGAEAGGLPFQCTGCGKCCQVEGDVWMSRAEQEAAAAALGVDDTDFKVKYAEEVKNGWVRLKDRAGHGDQGCVFLDANGQCSIYDHRPVQCSTYPWWPSILRSEETWLAERVLPSDAPEAVPGKRWNAVDGGCEGVGLDEIVPTEVIAENVEYYQSYLRRFQRDVVYAPVVRHGDAAPKEVTDVDMIEATGRWVHDFVVRLNLCPFASGVEEDIRYVVCDEASPAEAWRSLLREAELLKDVSPDDLAATMVILPKFTAFLPFQEISLHLEDTLRESEELGDHVMSAYFHPGYTFEGEAQDAPLNFEKRAPYPTINLLRAPQVDEAVASGAAAQVAPRNEERLMREGGDGLRRAFDALYDD